MQIIQLSLAFTSGIWEEKIKSIFPSLIEQIWLSLIVPLMLDIPPCLFVLSMERPLISNARTSRDLVRGEVHMPSKSQRRWDTGMYLHVSTIVCHTFQIKGDEIKESFTPSKIKGKLRVSVQAWLLDCCVILFGQIICVQLQFAGVTKNVAFIKIKGMGVDKEKHIKYPLQVSQVGF